MWTHGFKINSKKANIFNCAIEFLPQLKVLIALDLIATLAVWSIANELPHLKQNIIINRKVSINTTSFQETFASHKILYKCI